MIKKEIWVDCREKDLEELARLYGATGILGKSRLGLNYIPSPVIHRIESDKGIQKLPHGENYLFVEFSDWQVIPAENMIARYTGSRTRIIVKTNNAEEMRTLATTLEKGVDGFLVDEEESIKYFCSLFESKLKLNLVNATVTEIKRIEEGKRVCVDGIMTYKPREGLLVGFSTEFMFLADAETTKNPYVNTREWRVNAGAASLYALCKRDGVITPRILDDLVSGNEVVAVDADGNTRIETIGRVKKELRPMTYIQAEYQGKIGATCSQTIGATCSQTAETVRLVTPKGTKPVTEIKPGDRLKVYVTQPTATHFGRPVKERIIEV